MNSLDRSLHLKIDSGAKISVRDLPRVAWQHWLLVTFTAAVFVFACTLICFVVPPNYEVSALVSGQMGTSPQSDPNRLAPNPTSSEQTLNSQAQILQSEEVIRRALRATDLMAYFPHYNARRSAIVNLRKIWLIRRRGLLFLCALNQIPVCYALHFGTKGLQSQ